MKVQRIISKSKNGRRMEVICDDGKTRHIHLNRGDSRTYWTYRDDRKDDVFLPIEVTE